MTEPQPTPAPAAAPEHDSSAELSARLTSAARSSAFGQVAADTGWRGVLAALGGWRGVAEALLPGIAFIVLYAATQSLVLAVAVPAALGLIALVVRLVRREPASGAITGLFGMLLSGFIALASGSGVDYFLVGLWTNLLYGAGLLLTMLVGWPIIGVLVGAFLGSPTGWRRNRRLFWGMQLLTGLWAALFFTRLAVQVPLYQAGAVEALGAARVVMGVPLYAAMLVVTVVVARLLHRSAGDTPGPTPTPTASDASSAASGAEIDPPSSQVR